MKVLICIPCLLTGGTEIQTLNLVHALVSGGHEVTTVCYFEHTPAMVRRYEDAGSRVVLLSAASTRPVGVLSTLRFLFQGLRRVVKSVKPDVAHVQYMAPGAIPIFILRLLGMSNILVTVHTNADVYQKLFLIHLLQRYVVRAWSCITLKAEAAFFGSATLFSEETTLKRRNHFTVYNALPYNMPFSDRKRQSAPRVIGVVSRLEEIKGMDLVVPAFAEVQAKHPEVKLIVVGDGTQKPLMQQQAKELHVEEAITWAGRQPQERLHEWYGQMDIVLMPSRSEGFGLTAIEAMANGCVVIASDTGGLPEVVKDGVAGLLHRPEDISDLATKINRLVDDNRLYSQMQQALGDYVQQYSFARYAETIRSLYSKI